MSSTICVSGREVGAPRFSAYLVIAVLLQVGELLAGAPGDPARTAIPESALHWPKSAGGYASDGVTPLSSMEFFCFPAPTPTATATATPTATLTPRATPAPRVRPTPASRP